MTVAAETAPYELTPRSYGSVNWEGLKTLYIREVRRFMKVWMQTVAAPVVSTLLYMMIFVVAVTASTRTLEGVPFAAFVGPGLIIMAVLNNAFQNSSSSLFQFKINGTVSDLLTPPLGPFELTAAFALGAMTRGVLVGAITAACVWPFSHFGLAHAWAVIYFGAAAALTMGCIGVIGAMWAPKFDQLGAVTSFLVTPLTFLSGTFYMVERLPEPFRTLSHWNPFFYLIDGFRYGFIGKAEGSIMIGVILSGALTAVLAVATWELFRRGWRMKT
jgi:ABC-2 type transport system permease protein